MEKPNPYWKVFYAEMKRGLSGEKAISLALKSFKNEHKEKALSLLIDPGVKLVFNSLKKKKSSNKLDYSKELIDLRQKIANHGVNSVFTELALKAWWKVKLSKKRNKEQEFCVYYLLNLMDYFISLDLPNLIGTVGLITLHELEEKFAEIESEIRKRAKKEKIRSPDRLIKSFTLK